LAGRSKTRQGQDAKQVELKLRAKTYVEDQGTSQAKTSPRKDSARPEPTRCVVWATEWVYLSSARSSVELSPDVRYVCCVCGGPGVPALARREPLESRRPRRRLELPSWGQQPTPLSTHRHTQRGPATKAQTHECNKRTPRPATCSYAYHSIHTHLVGFGLAP
jgi:hypothetical protein